ncbi:hypothetical protein [Halarchaeum sp. P4]|uniref:hypothetical protein n=1 Tax=Halarchaeum sp. P4 TaxID=3421639 RepID=UPI003EBE5D29
MRTTLVAEPVSDVGADARVRDYDELDAGDATGSTRPSRSDAAGRARSRTGTS